MAIQFGMLPRLPTLLGVAPFTGSEQQVLVFGRCSPDAFTLRRCQMVLTGARGEGVSGTLCVSGCDEQTVGTVVHAIDRHANETPSWPRHCSNPLIERRRRVFLARGQVGSVSRSGSHQLSVGGRQGRTIRLASSR